MDGFLDKVLVAPLDSFLEDLLRFLPSVLTSVFLLFLGLLSGLLVGALMHGVLRLVPVDRLAERVGFVALLRKGGLREPFSVLLSRALGWFTVFVFSLLSLRALKVPAADRFLEQVFVYLPNVLVAALVLLVGVLVANFVGRAALIAAVNSGLASAGFIGRGARLAVLALALAMSLEQLGIGKQTVTVAFGIAFGGVVAALALAFGLGGRHLAREYLEKRLKGEAEKDELKHL